MLTEEQILENKNRFIELISSIDREGVDELIKYLECSDFFESPASTRFHGDFKGGLCAHSLEVYNLLVKQSEITGFNVGKDTLIICGLLHDLAKIGNYEFVEYARKVNGQWVSGYRMKDLDDRFIAGNHEETSAFICRQFIPMSIEEEVAIGHHHGGIGFGTLKDDAIGDIYKKYPITILLHTADLIAAYNFV